MTELGSFLDRRAQMSTELLFLIARFARNPEENGDE